MSNYILDSLQETRQILDKFISNANNSKTIESCIKQIVSAIEKQGKIISCGNGGSMCDAMHFAEELTGRFSKDRPALPAVAISDPSHLTCVSNDYGLEQVFSRFIDAFGKEGDILLAISTSGNSQNVINASITAQKKGMKVIGLLGGEGGNLKNLVDFPIIVPASKSERIQEIHIKIIHIFIEGIERHFYSEIYSNR